MSVQLVPSVYREYDIRGIVGRDLSPEFAELLGRAYAQYIAGRSPVAGRKTLTITVGWDNRTTSDAYSAALVQGLTSAGLDVIKLGLCPTPLTYFSLFHLDTDGGIM